MSVRSDSEMIRVDSNMAHEEEQDEAFVETEGSELDETNKKNIKVVAGFIEEIKGYHETMIKMCAMQTKLMEKQVKCLEKLEGKEVVK